MGLDALPLGSPRKGINVSFELQYLTNILIKQNQASEEFELT